MASAGNLGPKAEVMLTNKTGQTGKVNKTCRLGNSDKRFFREGHRLQLSALVQVVEAKVVIEVVQRLELLLCQV